MADRAARLAPLLRQTYDAALAPAAWGALVAQIATTFRGAAAIYAHDPVNSRANVQEFASFRPEFMRSYAAHYGATSPWSQAFRRLPVGSVLTRALVPELTLETTEYYNDWLKPQGLRDALGGILDRTGPTSSYVGILRAADRGEFPAEDKHDFRLLLDALLQAVRVHARIARASAHELALHQALDHAGLAAFVVTPGNCLVGHNRLAEDMLRAGRALRCRGGKLGAIHPRADDTLRRGIAQACRTLQGQTALLPLPGSDDPPLVAVVIPASAGASASFAAGLAQTALLLVKDPSRAPLPSGAVLGRVFGLTAAEARLTEALAAGKSIEQIGDERGTSRGTLRSQLKAAMAKTGTRRQGELIALSYRTVGYDTGEGQERRSYGTLPPFRRSPPPNPLTQGEGET